MGPSCRPQSERIRFQLFEMAPSAGLEPTTSGFVDRRSNPLSYEGMKWWEGLDLNQRAFYRPNLQSGTFNHSATLPGARGAFQVKTSGQLRSLRSDPVRANISKLFGAVIGSLPE
jgi:hypothetical protein